MTSGTTELLAPHSVFPTGPIRQEQEVRGVWAQATNLRAAGGGQASLVRWLREGARWVGKHGQREEVRGVPARAPILRAAGGAEEALVRWLRDGAPGCHEFAR